MLPKTRQPSSKKIKVTLRVFRTVAFLFLFLFSFCTATSPVHTQTDQFGIEKVGETIKIPASPDSDLRVLIVRILNVILGFLGIVAVCIVLYAGYLWMTSGGNEETVASAKKMLINGVIGLTIILSAFAITSFIFRSLLDAINGGGGGGNPPQVQTYAFSGALGRVIKDHYPRQNQREVARNTSIVVTFGVPVDPASLIENSNRTCWNADKSGHTTVCTTKTTPGAVVTETTPLDQIANPYYGDCVDLPPIGSIDMRSVECDHLITTSVIINTTSTFATVPLVGLSAAALTTYDSKSNAFTFVFKPHEYLGSSTEDVAYRVYLTTALMRFDTGKAVFENQLKEGYKWDFITGNFLDVDPPTVVDVSPANGSTAFRNSVIQITFSEPIDPTTVEGVITTTSVGFFSTILNHKPDSTESPTEPSTSTPGSWRLTNGYKTLEFISDEACGTNSCGEQMYCLPVTCTTANAQNCKNPYEALLRTAEWTKNADAPFEAFPFSGIYDLAFNGLDVAETDPKLKQPISPNKDLLIDAEERVPDNYWWNFQVSSTIDRSAPYVEEILPGVDAEDVEEDAPLYIQFSKRMMSGSLQGTYIKPGIMLDEYPERVGVCKALPVNQQIGAICEKKLPPIDFWLDSHVTDEKTLVRVDHRDFGPNNLDLYYFPIVPSTVKSVTQNCVYPGFGPTATVPASPNTSSTCTATYTVEGTIVPSKDAVGKNRDCVDVTFDPQTDTGCAFTPASANNTASTTQECIDTLHEESPSSY